MKNAPTHFLALGLSFACLTAADETSLDDTLTEAIYLENVDLDPEAAAEGYARIVESVRKDEVPAGQRDHAAAALFRLAEVRTRQGRKEEAEALFRELIDRFPEQRKLLGLARERLGIDGFISRQQLEEVTEEEEIELSENVFREVWKFSRRMRPEELVLTTFEVAHDEDYSSEGLPPEFSVRQLHYAPSGRMTKWFSRTQVHWTKEENQKRFEEGKKQGRHEYHGPDRWNCISGFGQSFVVPDGLHWSGGGWGDASMAFFFSDRYSVKEVGVGDYEEVEPTRQLKVRLKFEPYSRERAERLLAAPLKVELPGVGDEAWSLTLPPSPAAMEGDDEGQ